MKVGDLNLTARIDSGAEISIMNSACYEKLSHKPAKKRDVNMLMASEDATLKGFVTAPVPMRIGEVEWKGRMYVAPIKDVFLLGHDMLHHMGAKIDWSTEMLPEFRFRRR